MRQKLADTETPVVQVNCRISPALAQRLADAAAETGRTQREILSAALDAYIPPLPATGTQTEEKEN